MMTSTNNATRTNQTTSGLLTAYPIGHGTMYTLEQIEQDPFVERVEAVANSNPLRLVAHVRNGIGSRDLFQEVAGRVGMFSWICRN